LCDRKRVEMEKGK